MKVTVECMPCYLNQCINAMEKGKVPKEDQAGILAGLLPEVAKLDPALTPAENSTVILHKLVSRLGGRDLFAEAKRESNRLAAEQLPRLKRMVRESSDPLFTALQFSVAGNVIDLGLFEDYDLAGAIDDVLKYNFARSDYKEFRRLLETAGTVFIIGDNSGEIVFDRLLAEELLAMGKQVVYGVKGGFILNDATMEDARQVGLDQLVRVVDNGADYLGTVAGKCSKEFLELLGRSDIIISKGQANYESLEGTRLAGGKTFFLLKAKCPVVAGHLKAEYGDLVFVQNRSPAVPDR
ncbi:MAG: damage-control phosphatase ARMT1 family protein [Bacillota bacterium]